MNKRGCMRILAWLSLILLALIIILAIAVLFITFIGINADLQGRI